MEITRQFKPAFTAQTESASTTRQAPASAAAKAVSQPASEGLPLEQLQEALGSLPEIDLSKVEAIKQALQRGEISVDVGALSRSMLAYHNGSDA
ncbi:flagellar biosynthesis anti-sigma factor FlgM [Pseudomonas alcaligenes]|uniref:Negative regulator of flagellin synthesis n=1 Tax=Aquipseudomonas alcaligenes TaxID=43263 RepID=A0ABR7RXC1_AQUAC|nr:flagellar biosynthesis anti-sigma factor FlgM [Pseudomonas alcaligenes]MBC9249833.1 flagellar biosynthesis anti-sigma factor FlgM [Pseudomonas alcaligenes]